ncbi:flagellar hook-basal body complex protein FliE [Duffyella gerundensis]|uniref:flagellar hook-basal body complex protein FliE n=1 Tax=Duffyella TaxID=3026546 RepID=UPI003F6DBDB5
MAIQGIESMIQQLQQTALQAGNQSSKANEGHADFAAEMRSALDKISETQNSARQQAQDFELGKPGIALNDVMVDLQKSSISMQMGIQVRNKLVSAYSDIMNMQL